MRYPDAKHQNMAGVTHLVPSVKKLLHKVKQAGDNSTLHYSTNISHAMEEHTLSRWSKPCHYIWGQHTLEGDAHQRKEEAC